MNLMLVLIGSLVFELPAQRKSYTTLKTNLEQSGQDIVGRFRTVGESNESRAILRHIIAIERWSANRLRVVLHEKTFIKDENHAYKPEKTMAWESLLETFQIARNESLALCDAVAKQQPLERVAHNSLGQFSAKGWLGYIIAHGKLETARMKNRS